MPTAAPAITLIHLDFAQIPTQKTTMASRNAMAAPFADTVGEGSYILTSGIRTGTAVVRSVTLLVPRISFSVPHISTVMN